MTVTLVNYHERVRLCFCINFAVMDIVFAARHRYKQDINKQNIKRFTVGGWALNVEASLKTTPWVDLPIM